MSKQKILICLLLYVVSVFTLPTTLYVNSNSTSKSPNGSSWVNSYKDLQDALKVASEGDTIYVAGGTYYPTNTTNRSETFYLKSYVSIYGGFYGNSSETSIQDRPSPLQVTILDGDIGTRGSNSDNSYHVVKLSTENKLDGITIQNGYADADDYYDGSGGGIFIFSNLTEFSLNQVTFSNNYARQGGAVYVLGSTDKDISISNCIFTNNTAESGAYQGGTGGAIHLVYNADTSINNTKFLNNVAELRGGAVYIDYGSDVKMYNVTFMSNEATSGHGGGIFIEDRNSQFGSTSLIAADCNFTSNTAPDGYGGAISTYYATSLKVIGTNFTDNLALKGGAISAYETTWNETVDCIGCIFTANVATENSSLDNYWIGESVTETNVSYAYNATYYLELLYLQSESITSLYDKPTGNKIIYVNANNSNSSSQDGSTWASAFSNLQTAIDNASYYSSSCEIWVAKGTYTPDTVPSWSSTAGPEDQSFIMYDNVTMYGGFSGDETSRNERNWYLNPTYLDGTVTLQGNKAYQLLIAADDVLIDGFIFQHGYAAVSTSISISTSTSNSSSSSSTSSPSNSSSSSSTSSPSNSSSSSTNSSGSTTTSSGSTTTSSGSTTNSSGSTTTSSGSTTTSSGTSTTSSKSSTTSSGSTTTSSGSTTTSSGSTTTSSGSSTTSSKSSTTSSGSSSPSSSRRLLGLHDRRLLESEHFSEVLSDTSRIRGAGVFSNCTNIVITNSLFLENYSYKGGGLYCTGGSDSSSAKHPFLYNVAFVSNAGEVRGGGISADAYCDFYCEYCLFVGSYSGLKGGGIYVDYSSSPTITHSTFTSNYAVQAGGGIGIDGGGTLTLTNVTFNNNSANWYGGAIYSGSFNIYEEDQTLKLTSLTFSNNECPYGFDNLYIWSSGTLIANSSNSSSSTNTTSAPTNSTVSTTSSSSSTTSSTSSTASSTSSTTKGTSSTIQPTETYNTTEASTSSTSVSTTKSTSDGNMILYNNICLISSFIVFIIFG